MPRRPRRKAASPGSSFQKPDQPRAEGAGQDTAGRGGVRSPRCRLSLGSPRCRQEPTRFPWGLQVPPSSRCSRTPTWLWLQTPPPRRSPALRAPRSQCACGKAGLWSQKCSPLTPRALSVAPRTSVGSGRPLPGSAQSLRPSRAHGEGLTRRPPSRAINGANTSPAPTSTACASPAGPCPSRRTRHLGWVRLPCTHLRSPATRQGLAKGPSLAAFLRRTWPGHPHSESRAGPAPSSLPGHPHIRALEAPRGPAPCPAPWHAG